MRRVFFNSIGFCEFYILSFVMAFPEYSDVKI